jgi:hypothetical protein
MNSRLSMGTRLCVGLIATQSLVAMAQTPTYRSGETIQVASAVTVKVIRGSGTVFEKVTVTGVGAAFELQIDAPEKAGGGFIYLQPFKNPVKSTVVLLVGDTRIAPKAMCKTTEGALRPEVTAVKDLLPTRTGRGLWMSALAGRQTVHLLFDVPKESAEKPMTLSVDIGLDGKPTPLNVEIVK